MQLARRLDYAQVGNRHDQLQPNGREDVAQHGILLAAGQADLDPADVPDGVVLKRDGTLVVGAAVGTDQFVQDHLLAIVRQNVRKIEALHLLDPQFALLLLSGCLALVLGYHLQVTPPRLALAAAQAWDAAVDAARLRIASDPALGDVVRWWARHCWTCLLVRRDYHSSPADLDIPLPCCSAPLPSTLRTPSTLSLIDQGTRTRLLERELVPGGLRLVKLQAYVSRESSAGDGEHLTAGPWRSTSGRPLRPGRRPRGTLPGSRGRRGFYNRK